MAKKKVFVSYDHSEDAHYKNLLKAWDANDNFDFDFDQRSPDVAIDSDNASTIKQVLTRKMQEADYLLVIVGAKSYQSKWIAWEIDRAKSSDVKLKLAAVKTSNSNTSPAGLIGCNTAFATSFEQSQIIQALNKADNKY